MEMNIQYTVYSINLNKKAILKQLLNQHWPCLSCPNYNKDIIIYNDQTTFWDFLLRYNPMILIMKSLEQIECPLYNDMNILCSIFIWNIKYVRIIGISFSIFGDDALNCSYCRKEVSKSRVNISELTLAKLIYCTLQKCLQLSS